MPKPLHPVTKGVTNQIASRRTIFLINRTAGTSGKQNTSRPKGKTIRRLMCNTYFVKYRLCGCEGIQDVQCKATTGNMPCIEKELVNVELQCCCGDQCGAWNGCHPRMRRAWGRIQGYERDAAQASNSCKVEALRWRRAHDKEHRSSLARQHIQCERIHERFVVEPSECKPFDQ